MYSIASLKQAVRDMRELEAVHSEGASSIFKFVGYYIPSNSTIRSVLHSEFYTIGVVSRYVLSIIYYRVYPISYFIS